MVQRVSRHFDALKAVEAFAALRVMNLAFLAVPRSVCLSLLWQMLMVVMVIEALDL